MAGKIEKRVITTPSKLVQTGRKYRPAAQPHHLQCNILLELGENQICFRSSFSRIKKKTARVWVNWRDIDYHTLEITPVS